MIKRRVLVADDARINRRTLKVIYDSKYDVIEAENGEEAISVIEQNKDEIDLVLLDLNMPVKNGFDVLDFMRENDLLSQIPVMIITASMDQEDELRAFNSGATELVHKPFVPEIVLRRSENLIALYSSKRSMARELLLSRDQLSGIQKNDTLTGLLNMKTFLDAANEVLRKTNADAAQEYRFIYLNITNFKFYNVMHGLIGGDQILQMLASRILAVEPNALCSRMGQDHFVVMTTDDIETIRKQVHTISEDFDAAFGQYGLQLKAGVYSMKAGTENADVACELAKLACDAIRHTTSNVCEYTEELRHTVEIQSYAIQHIDEALNNYYIEAYYQPVVRTITGKTCGMEALARWNDPKKGMLSPGDFIPALEKNHLITKLDLYILRETCKRMQKMTEKGKNVIPISFNFSRVDFLVCDLLAEINQITANYHISHDLICIEITETALMNDPEQMKQEILRFRADGYQVWMDDFGSGYSSLNILKDFQFDEIKLDMKFMASFDAKSKEIVRAMVAMAKRIGIQTLAEGVETQEQYDFLRNVGCEKVQGYFYSKPVASESVETIPQMADDQVEGQDWKDYYTRISASNLVTEKAHAIIEYDGANYRFLYLNDAYRAALYSTGISDMRQVVENINSPISPVNRLYGNLRERCLLDHPAQSMVYSIRDHYVRINVKRIAEQENLSAYEVELIDLTGTDAEMTRSKMDKIGRRLFGMFDVIFEVDLKTGEAEVLRQGEYGYEIPQDALDEIHTIDQMNQIVSLQIHPDDLDAFWAFADPRTLKERLQRERSIYITGYFRIRQRNNEYIRKAFRIMYRSDFENAIYTIYYIPMKKNRIASQKVNSK